MDEVRILEIKQSVFKNNDEQADKAAPRAQREGRIPTQPHVLARSRQDDYPLKATIAALKDKKSR